MSFNLPANRLLKLTKGSWSDVRYPVSAVVEATLSPRDFFEPVDPQAPRSCVPAGGKDFSLLFNSNSGKMVLSGPTMFPPISVTFRINDGTWNILFEGRYMQLSQRIDKKQDLDLVLTHFEHTLPALLTLSTGLSIFCETVEIALGDLVEARSETLIPPSHFSVFDADQRLRILKSGIELIGISLSSARLTLASCYLREAIFFDSSYHSHNPYTHSLQVVLKCAQALEVLFGGKRDEIRKKCQDLGIDDEVIEKQIITIVVARNELGTAHASAFVPNPRQVEILRQFAQRSVRTVRCLLLRIYRADSKSREYLDGSVSSDPGKEKLLVKLEECLHAPEWCEGEDTELQQWKIPDPRLG